MELYFHSPIRLHGVVLSYSKGATLPFTFIPEGPNDSSQETPCIFDIITVFSGPYPEPNETR
jgi:hypothetical protein